MRYHDTIVIGAGQAGLALSHELTRRGIDHVLIERGRLGERWRSERWDSLRLLTPNWMTRLPGLDVTTEDPGGFRSKDDLVALLERYARSFHAPVMEDTAVTRVAQHQGGFDVHTTAGSLRCANVVVATGHCGRPQIPSIADAIGPSIRQLHASRYRNPDLLPLGGVVVVGAGASGIQIASELRAAGRDVVLSTGRHARAHPFQNTAPLDDWVDQLEAAGMP